MQEVPLYALFVPGIKIHFGRMWTNETHGGLHPVF